MNVMKKAHEMTREAMSKVDKSVCVITYRQALAVYLRAAHQEFKAMTPVEKFKAQSIAQAEKRIAELKAIDTVDGFIVVVGDTVRLPIEENKGGWATVENASIFWYREDAQRLAGRCVNGLKEVGQVVKKVDQIAWEISEQEKLIKTMKSF